MVKQTDRNADNSADRTKGSAGAKRAMDELGLPSGDAALVAKNAALESEVKRLTEELRAAKAVAAKLQEQSEALRLAGAQERGAAEAAPVPAAIEPLPKDLEPVLGREAVWSLVRPADGTDSRSVVERHGVFWKRFDKVLEERGPEGAMVLRKPLQEYIDALSGLEFERNFKKKLASRLSFMMRAIGLRIRFDGEVGALVAYGHKGVGGFRIQYCDPGVGAGRVYKGLGACLPAGVELVAEPPRRVPRMDSKLGRYKNL